MNSPHIQLLSEIRYIVFDLLLVLITMFPFISQTTLCYFSLRQFFGPYCFTFDQSKLEVSSSFDCFIVLSRVLRAIAPWLNYLLQCVFLQKHVLLLQLYYWSSVLVKGVMHNFSRFLLLVLQHQIGSFLLIDSMDILIIGV